MNKEIKNTQQLFVSCVVPKIGTPYVEILVFGNEKELEKTFVVVCSGGNPVESRLVEIQEMKWGNLPFQKVGHVRIFIHSSYLNFELSAYSVFETSDDVEKSRPFRFWM